MAKRRNLNGIPHNVIRSCFSTEHYWDKGYIGDWIRSAAIMLNLNEVTMDVINERYEPPEMNLYPLLVTIKDLKKIVQKELKGNDFPDDWITELKIKIVLPEDTSTDHSLYCYPTMVDKEGHTYSTKRIIESSYVLFDPFNT